MKQLNQMAEQAKRGQVTSEALLNADSWKQQGEALATKLAWREACRALYFSLLKRLDEKGVAEYMPTRTNYEYWYALARNKTIALQFREIANIVEASWFGNRSASNVDYQHLLAAFSSAELAIEAAQQLADSRKAGAPV